MVRVHTLLSPLHRPPVALVPRRQRAEDKLRLRAFESSQLKGGKAHFSRTSSSKNQTSQPQYTPAIHLLSCVVSLVTVTLPDDSESMVFCSPPPTSIQTVLRNKREGMGGILKVQSRFSFAPAHDDRPLGHHQNPSLIRGATRCYADRVAEGFGWLHLKFNSSSFHLAKDFLTLDDIISD